MRCRIWESMSVVLVSIERGYTCCHSIDDKWIEDVMAINSGIYIHDSYVILSDSSTRLLGGYCLVKLVAGLGSKVSNSLRPKGLLICQK